MCNRARSARLHPRPELGWRLAVASDRGLGMYIEDYHHREKVMKDKGLRPAPDLRADDEQIDKLVSDKLAHEAQARTFHNKLNQTSSIAEAARAITPENI